MPQTSPMSWTMIFWISILSLMLMMTSMEKKNSVSKFCKSSMSKKIKWTW